MGPVARLARVLNGLTVIFLGDTVCCDIAQLPRHNSQPTAMASQLTSSNSHGNQCCR